MDASKETQKFKLILVVGLIFCLAGYKSCTEIRYTISGVKTEARVTEIRDAAEARRSSRDRHAVIYSFKDERGKRQTGRVDVLASESEGLEGEALEVIYLPGDPDTSVPVSRRSKFWPIVFLGMCGLFGYSLFRLSR